MNKTYVIKFLTAPNDIELYYGEITDYADKNVCLPIEDLGLLIEYIQVKGALNSYEAAKIAIRKMFNKWKGYRFDVIGSSWYYE